MPSEPRKYNDLRPVKGREYICGQGPKPLCFTRIFAFEVKIIVRCWNTEVISNKINKGVYIL